MMHEGSRRRRCRWTVYYTRRASRPVRMIDVACTAIAGFADFVARGG